jgi:hypothetical protein
MSRSLVLALLLALGGCAVAPPLQHAASPCAGGEASYACQVERYQNAPVN